MGKKVFIKVNVLEVVEIIRIIYMCKSNINWFDYKVLWNWVF